MTRTITIIATTIALTGCPKAVVRDATAFQIETMAALKRQEEAASALREAAIIARDRGDHEACVRYAEPVLLIEASAKAQAYRALWLAGLPYPVDNPTEGEQPDPGPSAEPAPVSSICD